MSRLWAAGLTITGAAALAAGVPQRVVFKGAVSEHTWKLGELNPELPSDWTGFNYLVVEMKASSPQRFTLVLSSGPQSQQRNLQPLANVWIRAAVPLLYFRQPNRSGHSLASNGKVARPSFWMSTGGTYGPLNAVSAIGVSMRQPLGEPTLQIRSVSLAKEDPGSDILDSKPVVDEFGQWLPVDWPEKARDLAQLRAAWAGEQVSLAPGDYGWSRYGGYTHRRVNGSGFFRVEQVDGRWWFVDPDGYLFFSTACAGVGFASGEARLDGREDYFRALPPGQIDGARIPKGFYGWNLARRHGRSVRERAEELVWRRLDDWGFNTLGNWSDSALWAAGRKAYQVNLGGWGMREGYLGLPDVYAEEFPELADREAATLCAPRKQDPWLIGYFLGNEPPWAGKESLVVDMILDSKTRGPIQREAEVFLAGGDTPEQRKRFVYQTFKRFLDVIIAAVRRHDPNHLILGFRFAGTALPLEMLQACRVFDVHSLNLYSLRVDAKALEEIHRVTGRPILIGEFHFGSPGRGLAAGLAQVADQAERGRAYRHYVEQAASCPGLIGTTWFQWVDQPATGRLDGENYNIGLVDVTDRPYPELIAAMRATHRRLHAIHIGAIPPYSSKSESAAGTTTRQ